MIRISSVFLATVQSQIDTVFHLDLSGHNLSWLRRTVAPSVTAGASETSKEAKLFWKSGNVGRDGVVALYAGAN